MRKAAFFLVLILLMGMLTGCGEKKQAETMNAGYPAETGYQNGMCYISYEMHRYSPEGYQKAFEILNNMGVKSIRLWMHMTYFMDGEFNILSNNVAVMKDMIAEARKYGFQLIGMSHRHINQYYDRGPAYQAAKVSPESDYYKPWLQEYYRGWKLLAETFPEINIWEIDNETNNTDFMMNAETGGTFTLQQMADISTDLFYYGSKGVHEANPNAITVMGGLVTWNIKEFLPMLYINILSGRYGEGSTNPDDYFQALCWHPYMTVFNAAAFVKQNTEYYEIACSFEHKQKKVYLTEVGDFDIHMDEEQAAKNVERLYTAVKELPFVEAMHYHRMFNNIPDNNRQSGLFRDPNASHIDMAKGVRQNPGQPKLSAYAYQKVAGGEGPLDLLTVNLDN